MIPNAPEDGRATGRYLYCIVDTGDDLSLGRIGIDGNEVYSVSYRDVSAVVHDCQDEPYNSDDQDKLREWAMAHQATVESAWDRWGVVLPFTFNTVIRIEAGTDGRQSIRHWVEENYERLRQKIGRVLGKAEYGVQISWEPRTIARSIANVAPEIRDLEEEIRSKPRGLAYMYRQRLEGMLRKEMEVMADRYFKECYGRIRVLAEEVRVEKVKKARAEAQMILNLSCLVRSDKYKDLGEELGRIGQMDGLSVRFTGPWPPYSFVG